MVQGMVVVVVEVEIEVVVDLKRWQLHLGGADSVENGVVWDKSICD